MFDQGLAAAVDALACAAFDAGFATAQLSPPVQNAEAFYSSLIRGTQETDQAMRAKSRRRQQQQRNIQVPQRPALRRAHAGLLARCATCPIRRTRMIIEAVATSTSATLRIRVHWAQGIATRLRTDQDR
jgi:hypothetical protein